MRSIHFDTHRRLLTVLLLLVCSACGGGGSLSFGGGIGGSGVVFGSITELDPLVVDAIEIDTADAIVTVDGVVGSVEELEVGMVVAVAGMFDDGSASGLAATIDFESIVEGPILDIDGTVRTVNVLGDSVTTDPDTVLSGIVLDSAAVGTVVRVSGFVQADGSIRATLVQARPGSLVRAFSGLLTDLATDIRRFRLRNLLVDYTDAVRVDAPPSGLRDGLEARILVAQPPLAGVVSAIAVVARPSRIDQAASEPVRVEGIVTEVRSASVFVLNDQIPVEITRRTELIGGTAADILVGARVRVTGVVRSNRVLSAGRVTFRDR